MVLHCENLRLDGLQLSLRSFRGGQTLRWQGPIWARLCVLLAGDISEAGASGFSKYRPPHVLYKPPDARPNLEFGHLGAKTLTVELDPARARELRSEGFPVDQEFAERSAMCGGLGVRIYRELRRRDKASALVLEGLTLELLGEAWRSRENHSGKSPPKWLAGVRNQIHEEFGRPLTLGCCARLAGIHPIHLARSFRSYFGSSFGRYLRRVRIEYASRRLLSREGALSEIALASGFSDQSHFCNAFKAATGHTPGEFRKFFAQR